MLRKGDTPPANSLYNYCTLDVYHTGYKIQLTFQVYSYVATAFDVKFPSSIICENVKALNRK